MLEKGLVQIYTGDGKGKTTAAFGLAIRAASRQNEVLIYQFLKPPSLELGERIAVRKFDNIKLIPLEHKWDLTKSLHESRTLAEVRKEISVALRDLAALAAERKYDVMVLDEIVFCYSQKLASLEDIRHLIEARDPQVELVLTGRGADEELIELADLVTEMRKIKHPFEKGIYARKGIEY